MGCQIEAVGKRRDGGTRYWCLFHRADATAKYGVPADHCRASHIPPISGKDILILNMDEYPGGVALWGAVPPIYDTTKLPPDRGIHVHARMEKAGSKKIDRTYRAIKLSGKTIQKDGLIVSETDAIYYMVSSIFGFTVRQVLCTFCRYSHLDKDWFSVHPHRRHLCAGCGKYFRDSEIGIGNPIRQIQSECGILPRDPVQSNKTLNIQQSEYLGGIQIWGSNPAIIWSSEKSEEEGIHIHAYKSDGERPYLDDTYAEVTIDGVSLDPEMVRVLMAQNALPHLNNRVISMRCTNCSASEFSVGEAAFTPSVGRKCSACGGSLLRKIRLRKVIANPLVDILNDLAVESPLERQKHSSGLLKEAP